MAKKNRPVSGGVPPPVGSRPPKQPTEAPGIPGLGAIGKLLGGGANLGDILVVAGRALNEMEELRDQREARRIKMEELRRRVRRAEEDDEDEEES